MDTDTSTTLDTEADAEEVLDLKAVNAEIAEGAKAMRWLNAHTKASWEHWSRFIKGFRSLRSLVYAKARTTNRQSDAYRKQIGYMLKEPKYAAYDIEKQDRGDCYALMDRIEDIDIWYACQLMPHQQRRWSHPNTIRKHCPPQYVSGGVGHNNPPRLAVPKRAKPVTTYNEERLKALLIQVIKRLAKHEPDALELLDQVMSLQDPSDRVDDIGRGDTCGDCGVGAGEHADDCPRL